LAVTHMHFRGILELGEHGFSVVDTAVGSA
jgi:hypothetical protein